MSFSTMPNLSMTMIKETDSKVEVLTIDNAPQVMTIVPCIHKLR